MTLFPYGITTVESLMSLATPQEQTVITRQLQKAKRKPEDYKSGFQEKKNKHTHMSLSEHL